ncbi:MAG: ATP-binding protein [Anaerolineae bacterium]|nr:ATP-binding protein [Anaerolineae bacterium]
MVLKSPEIEGHILLVVDQKPHRSATTVLVGQAAYRIQHARADNPTVLRQILELHKPDVLILELPLAKMLGIEGCAQLKNGANPPLLVIALAPPRTISAEQTALSLGADDTLNLPWRPTESLPRLRSLLRLHRQAARLHEENQQLRQALQERDLRLKVALTTSQEYSLLRDSIVNTAVHEMSTPLLQVKSSISMLDSAVRAASEDSNLITMLDFAKQALTRLENVLDNFRYLARSLNLTAEPMHIEDSLNLALRALSRRWSSANKVHRVRISHGKLPLVLGDKQAIAQVLQQLIDNALKFSAETQPVEVTAQQIGEGVRVSVRDHGIGMEADQIERIFREFYQVESGSRRRFDGVGIGLSIVKLILDRLGVPIQVESQVGVGSTFSFTLRVATLR